jgi:hypothetical protein
MVQMQVTRKGARNQRRNTVAIPNGRAAASTSATTRACGANSGRWKKSSKVFVINQLCGFYAAGVSDGQQVGVYQHRMHCVWPRGGWPGFPKRFAPFGHTVVRFCRANLSHLMLCLQNGQKLFSINREHAGLQVVNPQICRRLPAPQGLRIKLPLRPGVKVLDDLNRQQGFGPQARIGERPFVKPALCRVQPPALGQYQQMPGLPQVGQHGRLGAQGHACRGRNGAMWRIGHSGSQSNANVTFRPVMV